MTQTIARKSLYESDYLNSISTTRDRLKHQSKSDRLSINLKKLRSPLISKLKNLFLNSVFPISRFTLQVHYS
ncbi:MAG: hypothetical protein ACOYN8_06490 [Pseudanabaena sp.]|jgi:hypothetical protein